MSVLVCVCACVLVCLCACVLIPLRACFLIVPLSAPSNPFARPQAHTDDNDESVSVLSSSSLAALDKKKSNAEKKKLQKAANDKAVGKPATDGETAPEPSQPEAPATELAAKSKVSKCERN